MSQLVERAREIYNGLPRAALQASGFWPSRRYELVFGFPPLQALLPIKDKDIFPSPEWKPQPKTVAVYVHIPFCQSICAYCHYVRRRLKNPLDVEDYLYWLDQEHDRYREKLGPVIIEATAESLHIGGGTPSVLSIEQLYSLLRSLTAKISFPQGIEMSIEANPASISRVWLEKAKEWGINRLNIGVQTFEDHLLEICERPHDRKQAREAIELAKGVGFDNINVDLIFGLPGQTLEDWERTLETLISLQPASVTCYRLRGLDNPRTAFSKLPESAFPSPENRLLMNIMAILALSAAGYTPIHFESLWVRDLKYIHRQQEHKWQGGELLGLGISAYSYLNGYVYHNTPSFREYKQQIRAGRLPIAVGRILNQTELMHRWMVLGLMRLRIERSSFSAKFGVDPVEFFQPQLQPLINLGLIVVTDEAICITECPGLLFTMEILASHYTEADKAKLRAKGLRYGSYPR